MTDTPKTTTRKPRAKPAATTPAGVLTNEHVFITGGTGFVGQALLERLLSSHPDTRMTVLVRGKGSLSGQARLAGLLRKPVFKKWIETVGEDEANRQFASRVTAHEGSLNAVGTLPDDIDVVIHSASTVSFDPPIDEAFDTNVGGAHGVYGALLASKSTPHVVHISTAYVGGIRKGIAPEASLTHNVDWRAEYEAAKSARIRVELESRQPEALRAQINAAKARHGKTGPQAVAGFAEAARTAWVRERLVDYGRTRAESLGWTDVYTLTKAFAERAAEELWAQSGHRLSIVRPSIIESSLHHPFPGWIDGYKVADPLIIAYGRGQLPDFPGLPDSILDVIPVDFVVNAALAVAARDAKPNEPKYYHVSSGASNPLPFHRMYENVNRYFTENPLPDGTGHITVPLWRFPGGIRSRTLSPARRSRQHPRSVSSSTCRPLPAPARGSTPSPRASTGCRSFAPSPSCTARTCRPRSSSTTPTPARCSCRCPRTSRRTRDSTSPRSTGRTTSRRCTSRPSRPSLAPSASGPRPRSARAARSPIAPTSLPSSTSRAPCSSRTWSSSTSSCGREACRASASPTTSPTSPSPCRKYLQGRASRPWRVHPHLHASLQGLQGQRDPALVSGSFGRAMLRRALPEALKRVQAHRDAGHRTVLVTGTIDLMVEPFLPYFDEVVAGSMHERDGVLTGFLADPPLVDEARAAWLRHYAAKNGFDLEHSYGYGDSHADLVWLQLLGNPSVVNPDISLYRHAMEKHWNVLDWKRGSATSKPILPMPTNNPAAPEAAAAHAPNSTEGVGTAS